MNQHQGDSEVPEEARRRRGGESSTSPIRETGFRAPLLAALGLAGVAMACSTFSPATPTPEPTATPTASSTPTVTATPMHVPTVTPVPTATPERNSSYLHNPDGSITFQDEEFGYQATFPSGWVLIELSEDSSRELASRSLEGLAGGDEFSRMLESASPGYRVMAFDGAGYDSSLEFPANGNITTEEPDRAFSLSLFVDIIEDLLPQLFPELEMRSKEIRSSTSGVELAVLQYSFAYEEGELDSRVGVLQGLFYAGDRLVTLSLGVDQEVYEEFQAEFDAILMSVELMEP